MLSRIQLETFAERHIKNYRKTAINGASIDIHLGSMIKIERPPNNEKGFISYSNREPISWLDMDITDGGYILNPGETILAHTIEIFDMPLDVSGLYVCKSSMARSCLNHYNAGFADAGWTGSTLTLELINLSRFTPIHISYGDAIGQMLFLDHAEVPRELSYAVVGRYNHDKTATSIKP